MSALRLRIAVVSDSVYPYHKGGKELRYHELLERLPGRGIDVDLYTMHWWDGAPPAGAIRRIAIAPRIEMYANGRRTIGQAIRFGLSCLRLLRIPRPAAIEADHMPYLQLFPAHRDLARGLGRPLLAQLHGPDRRHNRCAHREGRDASP